MVTLKDFEKGEVMKFIKLIVVVSILMMGTAEAAAKSRALKAFKDSMKGAHLNRALKPYKPTAYRNSVTNKIEKKPVEYQDVNLLGTDMAINRGINNYFGSMYFNPLELYKGMTKGAKAAGQHWNNFSNKVAAYKPVLRSTPEEYAPFVSLGAVPIAAGLYAYNSQEPLNEEDTNQKNINSELPTIKDWENKAHKQQQATSERMTERRERQRRQQEIAAYTDQEINESYYQIYSNQEEIDRLTDSLKSITDTQSYREIEQKISDIKEQNKALQEHALNLKGQVSQIPNDGDNQNNNVSFLYDAGEWLGNAWNGTKQYFLTKAAVDDYVDSHNEDGVSLYENEPSLVTTPLDVPQPVPVYQSVKNLIGKGTEYVSSIPSAIGSGLRDSIVSDKPANSIEVPSIQLNEPLITNTELIIPLKDSKDKLKAAKRLHKKLKQEHNQTPLRKTIEGAAVKIEGLKESIRTMEREIEENTVDSGGKKDERLVEKYDQLKKEITDIQDAKTVLEEFHKKDLLSEILKSNSAQIKTLNELVQKQKEQRDAALQEQEAQRFSNVKKHLFRVFPTLKSAYQSPIHSTKPLTEEQLLIAKEQLLIKKQNNDSEKAHEEFFVFTDPRFQRSPVTTPTTITRPSVDDVPSSTPTGLLIGTTRGPTTPTPQRLSNERSLTLGNFDIKWPIFVL